VANAGADQSITLPATASLVGAVTDDGLPGGGLTTIWSRVGGPGTATFADEGALATTVSFSVAGTYTLRLKANDGALSHQDDVVITVAPISGGGSGAVASGGGGGGGCGLGAGSSLLLLLLMALYLRKP
jgi:hypothetical protein